ncbi:hypothetical protein VSS74_06165 [Conexibacter stalactiti]|uniref:ATP-binding protein n=1 Tax=Conexibacter stalactiti TaxID=1940611 RepID=A0ABU4HKY1_9ACTN|nr:hypothetical protein [Conexibacter stalactiti]MDW5593910.1 hypothetical protein [Conexibacter stalactiti]MEC5034552.1 hypothetical protein [Conexibacter stalactiti]
MSAQVEPYSVTPMKASGIQHQVRRVYREGGQFQWVRETLVNSLEAGARKIEFGIEWQAVESLGVYRRTVADDGQGMTPDELVGFFNTWGGGGKPIGGVHENFGIGAKSSLLPWNSHGLVVISWVDGVAAMIWVTRDEDGEYGLRNFQAVDEDTGEVRIDEVVAPFYDEDHGCDWASVRPSWIEEHGTVMVLLGEDARASTIGGDPHRAGEADIKGISTYLNRRVWEVESDVDIIVDELRTSDPRLWPISEAMGHGPQRSPDRRTNRRAIRGALYYVKYPESTYQKGKLSASGTFIVSDGTEIDWFLWSGDRPAIQSYAAQGGYLAALYHNELYDVTNHHSTYRSFGILESAVRSKVWMIMRPLPFDELHGRHGVYPRGDRNSLLIMGGPHAGDPLPLNDWGAEFAQDMPGPIRDAIREARAGGKGTVTDEIWKQRLADRFGSRWRVLKLRASAGGRLTLAADQAGSLPRSARRVNRHKAGGSGGTGGTTGAPNTGARNGTVAAARSRVAGGIPTYVVVRRDAVGEGMLAAWAPNHPEHPEGAVLINVDHPVLEDEINHWRSQYPDHLADQISDEVVAAYGEIAVAKVAHSEHLKSILPSSKVDNDLRSEAALTMSLLGLIGEEAVIAPRIGGKYGRARTA